MKGSETRLVAYMQGTNNRFVIPVYQVTFSVVLYQFTIPMRKVGITNFWSLTVSKD